MIYSAMNDRYPTHAAGQIMSYVILYAQGKWFMLFSWGVHVFCNSMKVSKEADDWVYENCFFLFKGNLSVKAKIPFTSLQSLHKHKLITCMFVLIFLAEIFVYMLFHKLPLCSSNKKLLMTIDWLLTSISQDTAFIIKPTINFRYWTYSYIIQNILIWLQ